MTYCRNLGRKYLMKNMLDYLFITSILFFISLLRPCSITCLITRDYTFSHLFTAALKSVAVTSSKGLADCRCRHQAGKKSFVTSQRDYYQNCTTFSQIKNRLCSFWGVQTALTLVFYGFESIFSQHGVFSMQQKLSTRWIQVLSHAVLLCALTFSVALWMKNWHEIKLWKTKAKRGCDSARFYSDSSQTAGGGFHCSFL